MKLRLRPTDERYYELFSHSAVNALDTAREVRDLLVSCDDLPARHARIKDLERRGDQLTIETLHRLDRSYVTPLDREDIHTLAEQLDDVVDNMFAVADLLLTVGVTQPLPELEVLADVLVSMATEMVHAVGGVTGRGDVKAHLDRIQELEREGDGHHRRIIGHLFSGGYDAIEILRWKGIVDDLEAALNTIEDVGEVVESILLKSG